MKWLFQITIYSSIIYENKELIQNFLKETEPEITPPPPPHYLFSYLVVIGE